MICQECKERPATLHFTKNVNGEKTVMQLCEKCAQDKGDFFIMDGAPGLSINQILAGLLNIDPVFQNKQSNTSHGHHIIQCEGCQLTFQKFINSGKFGCAKCYEAFKDQLSPILKRLHSGNTVHEGKVPARIGGSLHIKKKLQLLKEEMRQLVEREEFEKAAEIRDQIRFYESEMEGNNG